MMRDADAQRMPYIYARTNKYKSDNNKNRIDEKELYILTKDLNRELLHFDVPR